MKKYGLGIIGFGGMGYYHYQKIAKDDRMFIAGIYDINDERMKFAAEQDINTYESAEALLADEKVNIVLVATPNNFHKEYSIAALRAKKAVICEKPVTLCSSDLEDIIKVAEEEGCIFTVHQNRRMDKDYLLVKEAYEKGTLGNIFSIESRVHGARGVPDGWRQYKVAGGGMLLDWGVHLIDQIMNMLPEKVVSVYTHMFSIKYPEVDDYFKLHLKFESGKSAQIEVGTCNFISMPRWYVCGDNGTMIVENWSCDGKIIRAKETEEHWEEDIVYTKAGPTKTMAPRRKETTEEIPLVEPDTDYTRSYKAIIDALEGNGKPLVDPKEALRVVKVIEATFESFETGKAIETNI